MESSGQKAKGKGIDASVLFTIRTKQPPHRPPQTCLHTAYTTISPRARVSGRRVNNACMAVAGRSTSAWSLARTPSYICRTNQHIHRSCHANPLTLRCYPHMTERTHYYCPVCAVPCVCTTQTHNNPVTVYI